jgi:hypothetical protein
MDCPPRCRIPALFSPFIIIWRAFNVDITIEDLVRHPSSFGVEDITVEDRDITIEDLVRHPSSFGVEDITVEDRDLTIEDITAGGCDRLRTPIERG